MYIYMYFFFFFLLTNFHSKKIIEKQTKEYDKKQIFVFLKIYKIKK